MMVTSTRHESWRHDISAAKELLGVTGKTLENATPL
jgi:hypothetical protein